MPGFKDNFSEPPITRRKGNEPERRVDRPDDFELYDSTRDRNRDRDRDRENPDGTSYDATNPDAINQDDADPNAPNQGGTGTGVDTDGTNITNPNTRRTARSRGVLTTDFDERQESEPGRRSKFASKFDEELDKSRKAKLWQRSNWIGAVVMLFILTLAYLNICSDVRGEYGGIIYNHGRSEMIICSVTHGDGLVNFNLLLPDKPMLLGEITEDKIGQNVEVLLKPRYRQNNSPDLGFKGKIDASEINGLVQEGLHLYPLSLKKDPMASVIQQLRALIPGANKQIDMNALNRAAMNKGNKNKTINGTTTNSR